jgi:hypothetical protein
MDVNIKLSKLVKENVLESKNGLYSIKKEYLKKWVKEGEGQQE